MDPARHSILKKATDIDCYHFLHIWLLADNANNHSMTNIDIVCVFEIPGKMGATGLVDLTLPNASGSSPSDIAATSGSGYGGFIIRTPVVGPAVRVLIRNNSNETYTFTAYGYLTR